jgi:hypothetical protein
VRVLPVGQRRKEPVSCSSWLLRLLLCEREEDDDDEDELPILCCKACDDRERETEKSNMTNL